MNEIDEERESSRSGSSTRQEAFVYMESDEIIQTEESDTGRGRNETGSDMIRRELTVSVFNVGNLKLLSQSCYK